MAARVEEEEAKDEDLRSMDLGEAEVAPPRVDFRTTLVMPERNELSSVASSRFRSCFSLADKFGSLKYRAL